MVWDYYDGPRSGIADFNGSPDYFSCELCAVDGEYLDKFKLAPIDIAFLCIAKENWAIYKKWEAKFHAGLVELNSHPGHGGIDERYDELEMELQGLIKKLAALDKRYVPQFRAIDSQGEHRVGVLRELEVFWEASLSGSGDVSP